jgi:PAS domain S-box-containing protein
MPDANNSKRLQKTILLYSTVGMLVVGVAVGVGGVLPLARRLREAQERNLMVDLQRQTVAVEQFVTRVHNAAIRASTRSQTRERLGHYFRGQLPKERVSEEVGRFLREQMDASTNLLGVQVFDQQTNLLVRLGRPIPREQWVWPEPAARDPSVSAPLRNGTETLFVCSTPVLDFAQTPVGIVMVLYQGLSLQKIIEDTTGMGRTGETIIGSRQIKALPIFFPMRQARESKPTDPHRISTVMEALKRAMEMRAEVFEPSPPLDSSLILAHGPVKGVDWGLVVCMNRTELLSGINRQISILATVLLGLILLGTAGMVGLLRPLAGRVILHTDELESQIYEKTAALNTELAERKRAEQLMRDSEALYHSLVDTLPINILRKDLFGRVSYGNRGYCERMGKPLSELLGKTDYQLFPKELADKYCRDDEKVVRSGEMFEDIEEHRSGDGRRLYVHVLKAPVRDAQGRVVGTQIIFWDVTARRLAEEALEKAAAELSRSNKELEQFAYVASHDLQEPLRMITSYTQLIAKRYQGKLDDDAKDFMQFAVDGALRMQKLIQGLLYYSRVGTRGKPFEATLCSECLAGALANLKISIEETGATVLVPTDPLPTVMGDAVQLTQLFQNIISNALKFRNQEPPVIRVEVERQVRVDAATLGVAPYELVFHLHDNGIGIEPQYFERIFVIFQRLHTQDQYPGTGIGLAICRKIVERHGGRIWVESKPGQGTCFHFTLPSLE